MKKILLISLLILLGKITEAQTWNVSTNLQCTRGVIVVNGNVVADTTYCTWLYTPQHSYEVIDDDTLIPPGATLVSKECHDHRNTHSNLPELCHNSDPGNRFQFNWNYHFLTSIKNMLCQVTPCSNPVTRTGPFMSGFNDNLAIEIMLGAGRTFWDTLDASQIPAVVMPRIHAHCQTFPENSAIGYDQQACYNDALDVMRELSPIAHTAGLAWLNGIEIQGFSISINGRLTNFGEDFFNKIAQFEQCSRWFDREQVLCP